MANQEEIPTTMRMRVNQFVVLTGLTAVETLRQPICLILVTSCLAFIALLPVLITHTLGEGIKLVRDSALAIHFVCGLILGSFAACATLSHEILRGTAAAVLSKPVNREVFFLAKYSGIALVLVLFSLAVGLATLLSGRTVHDPYNSDWWSLSTILVSVAGAYLAAGFANYFLRRPFSSTAFALLLGFLLAGFVGVNFLDASGKPAAFGELVPWELVPAAVLVSMAILVLAGIAVSLATRLDVVPTLTICSVILLLGLMSDYLFGRLAPEATWARVLHGLVPNWQHFWVVDALSQDAGIPWHYVSGAGWYGFLYLAAVLCIGTLVFRQMEVRA